MSALDFLDIVVHIVFILIGAIAILGYLRHRHETQRDVALMFGTLSIPFLLQLIARIQGEEISAGAQIISVIVLVFEPYFLLRLVRHLQSMPAYMMRLVTYSLITTVVIGILIGDRIPLITTAVSQGYLIGFNLYAMIGFARGVPQSTGVHGRRLRFAAAGSGLFALIFVVTLAANAIQLPEQTAFLLLEVLAGACAITYYIAFAPPRWLMQSWQLRELQHFLRQASKSISQDYLIILNQLSEAALRTVGGITAVIATSDAEGRHLTIEIEGDPPLRIMNMEDMPGAVGRAWREQNPRVAIVPKDTNPEITRWAEGIGAHALLIVPIASTMRKWGLLVVALRNVPLFAQDDLDLLELFVKQSAGALEFSLRIEESIQVSERRFRLAIEAASSAIIMLDQNGKIILANPLTEKYFGYPREELIGMNVDLLVPERFRGHHAGFRAGFFMKPQARPMGIGRDLFGARKDGSEFPVEIGLTPIEVPEGMLVMATIVDITERKHAEEQYRFLANLVASISDAVVATDMQLVIQSWNASAETLYGWKAEEVVGHPARDILLSEFISGTREEVTKQIMRDGFWRGEAIQKHRNGSRIPVWSSVSLYKDSGGKPAGIVAVNRDITELKRAEAEIRKLNAELEGRVRERTAELEAMNKELEAFSYSVSHDLRAPLRHISGFAEILGKKATNLDEQNLRYLTTISESAKRMGNLIDDLLDFSRMGRAEVRKEDVNVENLIREIIRELNPDIEGRDIQWNITYLPQTHGDRALLKSVWVNLIANALKFTGTRSQATIEIGADVSKPDEVVYYIRDNGVGFDMEYADKLFGLFQRLHRAEEFEGTGMGLANVRRIIHRHNGRTWAESAPERGATFYFSLPNIGGTL
ncbi:MAG: PAS domain S-box protein [Chloroflexota bacterium]